MAGKRRYTQEQVLAALDECQGLCFLAARRLGCHPNTVSRYLERYPRVREAVEAKRGQMVDAAELALYRAVQRGEAWAVQFCLKTLGRDRGYAERREVPP